MKPCLFICLLVLMIGCMNRRPLPPGIDRKMPAFNIQLLDTTVKVNSAAIPAGQPVVLFFFGPDCPYCQNLTREITKRMPELKDTRFYLMSDAGFKEIERYDTLFKLKQYENVTIGRDIDYVFFKYYKVPGFPYMAIYDKKKEFREIIVGAVSVDSLKKVLHS